MVGMCLPAMMMKTRTMMMIRKMVVVMMMIVMMMITMMTKMALTSLNPTSSACSACLNAFTISCGSDSWVADRPWEMKLSKFILIQYKRQKTQPGK